MPRLRYSIAVIFVLAGLTACRGWIRAKSGEIERRLLVETPVSTTKAQVVEISRKKGRVIGEGGVLTPNISDYPVPATEGKSYLRMHLGSYGVILKVDVIAFYIFDEQDRLTGIRVRKDVDAP